MHIHLIRHGKTEANENSLYCGATDIPLSDNGINELLALKERGLYPKSADLYFTSGMKRTEQTLDILYGPVPRHVIAQLREFNFGDFEMNSHDELENHTDYQNWIFDETGQIPCPGGESGQDFNRRVSEGFEMLCDKAQKQLQPETVLLICHGGVIVQIMDTLFPKKHSFYEWLPEPGRGYTLIGTEKGFELQKEI